MFVAASLMAYPYLSNYLFEHRADSRIHAAKQSAEDLDDQERQAARAEAEAYNQEIAEGGVTLTDPFAEEERKTMTEQYQRLLSINGDGVMGSIEIPSIQVSLPVYHGTSEEVLKRGVGHLEGTSLPVGGESTHTVLTGHTGLSHAKLFTDLEELEKGDIFFLYVLGDRLAYRVIRTEVVLPEEVDALYVEKGKDLCTLVTCTPYGVNSHRLFVCGERTGYKEAAEDSSIYQIHDSKTWMKEYRRALLISAVAFIFGITVWSWIRYRRNR